MSENMEPAEKRVHAAVWKRYESPRALVAIYFGGMGAAPEDVGEIEFAADGSYPSMDLDGFLALIEKQKMWAFCDTKADPVTVHYWHANGASVASVAYMLGHELGHICGTPLDAKSAPSDDDIAAEEYRANEYGAVAMAVLNKLVADGALR